MKLKHLTHALVAVLILIAAFSIYGFWYASVSKKSAEAATLAQAIITQHQDSARMQAAKDELLALSTEESLVNGYYVSTSDAVPFLESLQSTGQKLGSTVQIVSVSAEPGKPHSNLNLSLSITGSFDTVLRTLGAYEYAPYDASLQTLTLDTPQVGTGKASQWTAAATFLIGTTDAPQAPITSVRAVAPAAPIATTTSAARATTATTTP